MAKKVYLVDTENVGSVWIKLLELISKQDSVLLFYTENSPAVSYNDLQRVLKFNEGFEFIHCYSGRNGLDFQLITYLGYLVKSSPKSEYIIVSNDMGFDAAVKFWTERKKNIIRLNAAKVNAEFYKKNNSEKSPSVQSAEQNETVSVVGDTAGEIEAEVAPVSDQSVTEKTDETENITVIPKAENEKSAENGVSRRNRQTKTKQKEPKKETKNDADESQSAEQSAEQADEKKAAPAKPNSRRERRKAVLTSERRTQETAQEKAKQYLAECLGTVLGSEDIDWLFEMLKEYRLPAAGLNKIYCEIIKHFAQEKGLLVYKSLRPNIGHFNELIQEIAV